MRLCGRRECEVVCKVDDVFEGLFGREELPLFRSGVFLCGGSMRASVSEMKKAGRGVRLRGTVESHRRTCVPIE